MVSFFFVLLCFKSTFRDKQGDSCYRGWNRTISIISHDLGRNGNRRDRESDKTKNRGWKPLKKGFVDSKLLIRETDANFKLSNGRRVTLVPSYVTMSNIGRLSCHIQTSSWDPEFCRRNSRRWLAETQSAAATHSAFSCLMHKNVSDASFLLEGNWWHIASLLQLAIVYLPLEACLDFLEKF